MEGAPEGPRTWVEGGIGSCLPMSYVYLHTGPRHSLQSHGCKAKMCNSLALDPSTLLSALGSRAPYPFPHPLCTPTECALLLGGQDDEAQAIPGSPFTGHLFQRERLSAGPLWGPVLPQPGVLCSGMKRGGCGQGLSHIPCHAWLAALPQGSFYTESREDQRGKASLETLKLSQSGGNGPAAHGVSHPGRDTGSIWAPSMQPYFLPARGRWGQQRQRQLALASFLVLPTL